MAILSDLIERMITAGMSPSEAGAVAAEIYAAGVASASVRSPGAERTRRWRHKASQNVTERHTDQTSQTVTKRHKPSQSDGDAVLHRDTNIKNSKRQNSDRPSRGTRVDPSWTPSDADRLLARQEGFSDGEIDREALRFRDYWTGRAGAGGVKLDWAATWRNWVRTSAEKLGKTPLTAVGVPQPSTGFYAIAGGAELDAWDSYGRTKSGKSFPRDKNGGWHFPSRWPPEYVAPEYMADVHIPKLSSM